jgi:hypothetical protein
VAHMAYYTDNQGYMTSDVGIKTCTYTNNSWSSWSSSYSVFSTVSNNINCINDNALIFLLQWAMAERYFVLQIKAFLG